MLSDDLKWSNYVVRCRVGALYEWKLSSIDSCCWTGRLTAAALLHSQPP
jgi:hypothetical protein